MEVTFQGVDRLANQFPCREEVPLRALLYNSPLANQTETIERGRVWDARLKKLSKGTIVLNLSLATLSLAAMACRHFRPGWGIEFRWPTSRAEMIALPLFTLMALFRLTPIAVEGVHLQLWREIDGGNDQEAADRIVQGTIDPRGRYLPAERRSHWRLVIDHGDVSIAEQATQSGLHRTLAAIALVDRRRIWSRKRPILLHAREVGTARLLLNLGARAEEALASPEITREAAQAVLEALGIPAEEIGHRMPRLAPAQVEQIQRLAART